MLSKSTSQKGTIALKDWIFFNPRRGESWIPTGIWSSSRFLPMSSASLCLFPLCLAAMWDIGLRNPWPTEPGDIRRLEIVKHALTAFMVALPLVILLRPPLDLLTFWRRRGVGPRELWASAWQHRNQLLLTQGFTLIRVWVTFVLLHHARSSPVVLFYLRSTVPVLALWLKFLGAWISIYHPAMAVRGRLLWKNRHQSRLLVFTMRVTFSFWNLQREDSRLRKTCCYTTTICGYPRVLSRPARALRHVRINV